MKVALIIGFGLALNSSPAASGTFCNISGANARGVEYILAMEGVGATHDESSAYKPDELLLKNPKTGEVKTYSANHCLVRFYVHPISQRYSNQSYIRCSQAGRYLRNTFYKWDTRNPKHQMFVCVQGCNSGTPKTLDIEDCNAEG